MDPSGLDPGPTSRLRRKVESPLELPRGLAVVECGRPGLGDDQDIPPGPKLVAPPPEDFPHEPLHPVSFHGAPDSRAHGHAEPGVEMLPGPPHHDEVRGVPATPFALQTQVIAAPTQPNGLRKAVRGGHRLTRAVSEGWRR